MDFDYIPTKVFPFFLNLYFLFGHDANRSELHTVAAAWYTLQSIPNEAAT
jgi:hypothetical protein